MSIFDMSKVRKSTVFDENGNPVTIYIETLENHPEGETHRWFAHPDSDDYDYIGGEE